MLTKLRIVGSGLIGTSIALGLRAQGVVCQMVDNDPVAQHLANDLVRGEDFHNADIVILALPTSQIPMVIETEYALNPKATFMDVGSIKCEPIAHIKTSSLPISQFVPTHPMAGREIGGAKSARGDLFATRSWVMTPTRECSEQSLEIVKKLVSLLGASIVILDAAEHDRAVAQISHLPQILSSLLAQGLNSTSLPWLDLAGAGLRDTTRIAASDPVLWSEIIFSNRGEILPNLKNLSAGLTDLIENIDDKTAIASFIQRGREGVSRIPGKHGGRAREYTQLPIVINDQPGQLAAIFNECAKIAVNIEDLVIEHSPGQLSALITLSLCSKDATLLSDHLSQIGWNVHPIVK